MRNRILVLAALLLLPTSAGAQRVVMTARIPGTTVVLDADSVPSSVPAADGRLWNAIHWDHARPGLEWTEIELSAGALGISMRVVAVAVDPRLYRFQLAWSTKPNGMTGDWTVEQAPPDAAIALNAGQFRETGPWGWVVLNGEDRRDPGTGPLSVGVAVTDSGSVRWIPASGLTAARGDPHIAWAFQTYPLLLADGRVPPLARDGALVDQNHRDARLLLGERADGSLLIVLSRFDGLGSVAEQVPIGLTVPESIALMEALGARNAAMLDGGISAQMLLRGAGGRVALWKGLRAVPLALIATPR